ncbi:MAG TPA: outer membrane lipoprotein carrier protein LolA [Gammaproteobacteria bacterium]|nr:outer membrane lipoprotein carrier protein LolA [Gammaproteobacteria bacterium]
MKLARLLTGPLLVCVASTAFAASSESDALPGVDVSFVQTRTLPGFSAPLVSHGIMRFDQKRGFHWEITAPYHYVFEMNGRQAREQLPDGSVRHLNPDQTPWLAAVEHIFISALAGNTSDLQRYFQINVTPLNKGRRVLLMPKPGPMAEAIVSIQVTESAPGHPQQLGIKETSGGRMDIRFTPVRSRPGS